MPFSYYHNLSKSKKAIYRQSDRTKSLKLPDPKQFEPLVLRLRQALQQELQPSTRRVANLLCRRICRSLKVEPPEVRVLSRRPSSAREELHGLYVLGENRPAQITVWMRTAKHSRVVAFKTFLRTLIHELCHHLDYTMLKLKDSYHTEGFFLRESNLVSQLMPAEITAKKNEKVSGKPVQMQMPF